MMGIRTSFRCPVCKAKFRSTRECSRCGADLSILMTLAAEAQVCRENARKAIYSCDFQKAHVLAKKAQNLHKTEVGRRLLLLTSWLYSGKGEGALLAQMGASHTNNR